MKSKTGCKYKSDKQICSVNNEFCQDAYEDLCKNYCEKYPGLYPCGSCWKCGRQMGPGILFCVVPKKCEQQYNRDQERGVLKGKRAGYRLAGSAH